MMKKIILLLTFILPATSSVTAQETYKVGDTIKDFQVKQILNSSVANANFKSLAKKLTIIDFWGTWCAPCVESIPEITALQQKYKDRVSFLLVSNEEQLRLERFLQTRKSFTLPIILDADESIFNYFKPTSYPRYVFIDENQKVLAITGKESVNDKVISALLEKKEVTLSNISEVSFDTSRPLSGNDNLTYQSVLRPYLQGGRTVSNSKFMNSEYAGRRILAVNMTIPTLLQIAYEGVYTRTVIELKDESINNFENRSNLYCYDLILPKELGPQRFVIMQQDMIRNFPHIKADFVEREKKVYVLKITSHALLSKYKTKAGKPDLVSNWNHIAVYNRDFNEVIAWVENYLGVPVVTESTLPFHLDVEFDGDMSKIDQVRQALNKIGLDLIEDKKVIPVLVIHD
jgi:thiol-disulfide isomerase/thioredoxin